MDHKLVADVFDVLLIDPDTLDVAGSTTLQDANIEVSLDANDVNAGKDNALIAIIHSTRNINIALTDVEWKYEFLAKQLGQDIVTGAGVAYAMPKWYTVEEETAVFTITLDEAPILDEGEAELLVIKDDTGALVTVSSVTGNEVTLTGVTDGQEVEVVTYTYESSATTETIDFDNNKYAKKFICVLETLEINEDEEPTYKLQYQFTSAKPTGEFSIETTSERSAGTQSMNLRVLKPKTTSVVGKAMRIPITA